MGDGNGEAARQLIVCCDGTNNTLTAGVNDTNVVKLLDILRPAAQNQKLYYDPGVGAADTLPSVGLGQALRRRLARIEGLASGRGIYENIANAYKFLAQEYREGDEIFLFGFSRGAFTVRAVAGMVNLFGLVRVHNLDLLDLLVYTYFSRADNLPAEKGKKTRREIADDIRERFSGVERNEVHIHFLGVWDTVASVGMPGLRQKVTSNGLTSNKRYRHIRHALSQDEARWTFAPRIFWESDYHEPGKSLEQRWFRGVHADIGGGYAKGLPHQDAAGLGNDAFRWMLGEAVRCHLRVDADELAQAMTVSPMPALIHSEPLASPWWGVGGLLVRDRSLPPEERQSMDEFVAREHFVAYQPQQADLVAPKQRLERWQPAHVRRQLLLFTLLTLLMVGLTCLYGQAAITGHPPTFPQLLDWPAWLGGGIGFDAWQRHLFLSGAQAFPTFSHAYAAWAIAWDFGLIACYAWLLGFAGVRLFELVRVRAHPADGLGWRRFLLWGLGWLPCFTVLGDMAENLASLAWLASDSLLVPGLPLLCAAVMALANVVKWLALGSALLAFVVASLLMLLGALPARWSAGGAANSA
jgi:uncharacterized protein (DUF2235 family)